jgi:hypothetical protein
MSNYIKYFDLFSTNITLYTKSYSKVWTYIGFFLTIISVMLLGLIFYFESYEVFKLDHPNIASFKQNINKTNSTLSINNNTFNFYISLGFNFPKEMLFNHLVIYAEYRINDHLDKEKVMFEECNNNDKTIFQKLIKRDINFNTHGINLCPRINFEKLENITSFNTFVFQFKIRECDALNKVCTPDYDFYNQLYTRKKFMIADMYYIDSQMDLTDYDNPYWFEFETIIAMSGRSKASNIKLEGSEISTKSLFNFYKPEKKSQFSILSIGTSEIYFEPTFLSYIISFNSKDMYIYNRTYKTLNSAFANSFALFKLITWVFSVILSPYYIYCKNVNIINKSFNYAESMEANNNIKVGSISVNNNATVAMIDNRRSTKLTTCTVIKNVSLMRYVLCRRINRTRLFYKQAQFSIRYSLSIENLLSYIIDYSRLKQLLLRRNTDWISNESGQKLVLNNELKVRKEDLRLDVLISNKENITLPNDDNLQDSINNK